MLYSNETHQPGQVFAGDNGFPSMASGAGPSDLASHLHSPPRPDGRGYSLAAAARLAKTISTNPSPNAPLYPKVGLLTTADGVLGSEWLGSDPLTLALSPPRWERVLELHSESQGRGNRYWNPGPRAAVAGDRRHPLPGPGLLLCAPSGAENSLPMGASVPPVSSKKDMGHDQFRGRGRTEI
jgi:hypothetical protein